MTAQLRKESLAGRESIGMFPPSTQREQEGGEGGEAGETQN